MDTHISEFIRTVRENPSAKFDVIRSDGTTSVSRLFVGIDTSTNTEVLASFDKGKRKSGKIFPLDGVVEIRKHVTTPVSPEKKFRRNCDKVISILESSGLWSEILSQVRYLKNLGYQKTDDYYNGHIYNFNVSAEERQRLSLLVPAEFRSDTAGMLLNCKLASVRLADSDQLNEYYLSDIRRAMQTGTDFRVRNECRSYDRSFHYDAKANKAWYSLEYRGCGNGHYYLALSSDMALFCEDD